MNTIFHRIKQFIRATRASVAPRELAALAEYLDPAQRALFAQMVVSDQRHSLDLFYILRGQGETDDALLQAALLHDAGKSQTRIHLWQRAVFVLMGKLSRRLRERFCASPCRNWRYAFFVLAHHTDLGAEMAQRAGCSDEVVALIRNHQRSITAQLSLPMPSQRKLRVLQAADNE